MRASRLISLLMLLQARGRMTAAQLARELEVTPRTIYRDLDELSAAGVPVYTERGPAGGCGLLESYRTSLTGLHEDEARALFAMFVPGVLAPLGQTEAVRSAQRKLLAALPANQRQSAQWIQERLHLDPTGWLQAAEPVPFLPLLQDALWRELRVRMVYRRADGTWVRRLIDPYGLVAKGSAWYCVAAAQRRVYCYRVARIVEAALTDSPFQRPADFDLVAFWSAWVATLESTRQTFAVTLSVAPGGITELAALFGEGVHALAAEAPMVANRLAITLTFESPEAACRRLLALPETVALIAPAELRRDLRRRALQVARRYEEGRE